MRLLAQSEVKPDEIDHLGHMNVRFYSSRAQEANQALMASFGLDAGELAARGAKLVQSDTYCRYHREQFAGSTLAVKGGVLSAAPDALSLYFELDNGRSGHPRAAADSRGRRRRGRASHCRAA
jgi:acyl-CoA thioester hydrolase